MILNKLKISPLYLVMLLGVISQVAIATPDKIAMSQKAEILTETPPEIPTSAKEIVLNFQNDLLNIMQQGKALGFQGRYKKLETIVGKSHNLAKMASIVVGKKWKKLSQQQKEKLITAFSHLTISAYSYNFKEFSDEKFLFLSEAKTTRGDAIVHTLLELPEDKDVKLDYMLKKNAGNWQIINIIANGVSELALKRSEYSSVLKSQGFEVLIAKISKKTDNYAKKIESGFVL